MASTGGKGYIELSIGGAKDWETEEEKRLLWTSHCGLPYKKIFVNFLCLSNLTF